MAKKSTAHLVPYQFKPGGGGGANVVVVRPSPATSTKGRGKGHRRHAGGSENLMHLAIVAFALGKIDKDGTSVPTIPALGRAGTIAAGAHFLGKGKKGWVTSLRNAATVIALYEMGQKGTISGGGVSGGL